MLQEGRTQALRESLTRLLRARFGTLDGGTERLLGAASAGALDRWLERALTAERRADVVSS